MAAPLLSNRPAIGYAMWHLDRGDTPADVLTRLQADARYGGFSEARLRGIVSAALENLAATAIAQGADRTRTIGSTLLNPPAEGELIGVRVNFTVVMPDGTQEIQSIVVNAQPGASLAWVQQAAQEMFEQLMRENPNRPSRIGVVAVSSISSVFEGGLEGALSTVMA